MTFYKKLIETRLGAKKKLEFAPHMKEEFQQFTKVAREIHATTGVNLFPFLDDIEVPVQDEPVDSKLSIHVLE